MTARAVAAGSGVGFAAGWNIADVGAVADELADAYGVGLGVIGLLTTVLFLTHMLMQLPSGRFSDRFGAGRVCVVGLSILVACNILLTVAASPVSALAGRFAMGVEIGRAHV